MSKKICSISLILLCLFFVYNVTYAQQDTYHGIAYAMDSLEKTGELENISIVENGEKLTVDFRYKEKIYCISLEKEEDYYVAYQNYGDAKLFAKIFEREKIFTGLVRVLDNDEQTLYDFGLIMDKGINSDQIEQRYLNEAKKDKKVAAQVKHNMEVRKEKIAVMNSSSNSISPASVDIINNQYRVMVTGSGGEIAEVWAERRINIDPTRSIKITQYNVRIGIIGDGCYLRQHQPNGGNGTTLFSTPTSPPAGIQTVNQTYVVSMQYNAYLDATVTSLFTIDLGTKIPLPFPVIHADGVTL